MLTPAIILTTLSSTIFSIERPHRCAAKPTTGIVASLCHRPRRTDRSSRGSVPREFRGMQLYVLVHADWLLACELKQVVGHTVVAALLVHLRHHGEVLDDVRWHAR